MRTAYALIMIWLAIVGCAGQGYSPVLSSSPQTRFVIEGYKRADVEARFEVLYSANEEHCLIDRPGSSHVVRTHRGERQSYAAGVTQFRAEFYLDRFLPGDCRWHASSIEVSVNRPPYNAILAGWTSLVSFELWAGTQAIDELTLNCAPEKPNTRALTCKGQLVNADRATGKLSIKIISD